MSRVLTQVPVSSTISRKSRASRKPQASLGAQAIQKPKLNKATIGLLLSLGCLGFAAKLAGIGDTPPKFVNSSELSQAEVSEDVVVTATVVSSKPATDGRPLLTIATDDGYQSTLYITDDAAAPIIELGKVYVIRASVSGSGFLVANKAGSIHEAKHLSATTPAVAAQGYGYIQTATGTARVLLDPKAQGQGQVTQSGSSFGFSADIERSVAATSRDKVAFSIERSVAATSRDKVAFSIE